MSRRLNLLLMVYLMLSILPFRPGTFAQAPEIGAGTLVLNQYTNSAVDPGNAGFFGGRVGKKYLAEKTWIVINDRNFPVELGKSGADQTVLLGNRYATFILIPDVDIRYGSAPNIAALNVRFLLLNEWGEPQILVDRTMRPGKNGWPQKFNYRDGFFIAESEYSRYKTCITFVRRMLLSDGSVFQADLPKITALLKESKISVDPDTLETSHLEAEHRFGH